MLDDLRYTSDQHVDAYFLDRFDRGLLSEREREGLLYHLDECPDCQALVKEYLQDREKRRTVGHKKDPN